LNSSVNRRFVVIAIIHLLAPQSLSSVSVKPREDQDTLEAFSFVRMEGPVVEGWDPALDLTRCKGSLILDVPPGSEQALGGERRLTADITYTAQGAADASGLVYAMKGEGPIVSRLASFDLSDATYRPLPAVDDENLKTELAGAAELPTDTSPRSSTPAIGQGEGAPSAGEGGGTPDVAYPGARVAEARRPAAFSPSDAGAASAAENTVRTFYSALGAGNGEAASAQVISTKRSSRAYSADAISRFYGRLPEPLRLTGISPLPGNAYRVTYRYAAPGLRCNGSAVVRLTSTATRPLIRSITAANGC
jgi:hypothetical protein